MLGNLRIVYNLNQLVKEKKPSIVFLMETRLTKTRMDRLKVHLGFHSLFIVDRIDYGEGLALMWKDDVNIHIQCYS